MSQPGVSSDAAPGGGATRPARSTRWRHVAGLVLVWIGWIVVGLLGLVVLARMVAWDRWRLFADVDAAVEVLYLPAWLVLLGGLIGRKWWLAGAAALLCAAQVVYVAPEVLASAPVTAAAWHEPTIHLFDANVQQDNDDMSGYIAQIKADRPDVVTLEETHAIDLAQLRSSGAFRGLPYQFFLDDSGSRGFIVASRYPLGHASVSSVHGLAYLVRLHLRFAGHELPFWVVHTTAPVNPNWNNWNLELDGVEAALTKVHPRPLLMVGDFNASWGNRGFRAILSTGLTDAAAARGQPFDFTWSQRLRVVPPFIRIDHVLTAGNLVVTTIASHEGHGSGHRDLTADVAVGG